MQYQAMLFLSLCIATNSTLQEESKGIEPCTVKYPKFSGLVANHLAVLSKMVPMAGIEPAVLFTGQFYRLVESPLSPHGDTSAPSRSRTCNLSFLRGAPLPIELLEHEGQLRSAPIDHWL